MGVNKNNVKIHISHLKKNFGKLEVLKDVSTDIYEGVPHIPLYLPAYTLAISRP